ncbi:hypothetical protein J6590_096304 [Homalodisca vitripennis]|nr:hypothetical protein J6590_096304 [Homalodisca vitripennis]
MSPAISAGFGSASPHCCRKQKKGVSAAICDIQLEVRELDSSEADRSRRPKWIKRFASSAI